MFSWLQKDIPVAASVFFRGTWPCNKEGFLGLKERGIEITERETPSNGYWALKLKHAEWGGAVLLCLKDFPMPPQTLIDWDAYLSDDEKAEAKACGTGVSLMVMSRRNHLLRDRKNALFFMEAVMGEEGVVGLDHLSGRFWSREALKMETAHKADADAQSLFTIHYVAGEATKAPDADELEEAAKTGWLHTHGLAEIGLFDFDILNPSKSVLQTSLDAVRAVAFAILDGSLKPGGSAKLFSTGGPIVAVPAKDFAGKAKPEWAAIRDDPGGDHIENRVVLCETAPSKWFGRIPTQVRPSKSLSEEFPDDFLIQYSSSATELMAERARATYPVFRGYCREFAALEIPCLVKIGCQVDGGAPTDREHLWFQVHEAREKEVDATLVNAPLQIARMKEGQRGAHSIEHLSDWQILAGQRSITPRDMSLAKVLRTVKAKAGEEKK
jgi:hypothetical protein